MTHRGWLGALGAVVALLLGVTGISKELVLAVRGEVAAGVVVVDDGRRHNLRRTVVEFTTAQGQKVSATYGDFGPGEGTEILVRYDRSKPTRARRDGSYWPLGWSVLQLGLGSLVCWSVLSRFNASRGRPCRRRSPPAGPPPPTG